jgi:hypothetical protein
MRSDYPKIARESFFPEGTVIPAAPGIDVSPISFELKKKAWVQVSMLLFAGHDGSANVANTYMGATVDGMSLNYANVAYEARAFVPLVITLVRVLLLSQGIHIAKYNVQTALANVLTTHSPTGLVVVEL